MKNRFEVLDSFRGIAAILVAIYHFHIVGTISNFNIIKNSYLFVEFFFVLSGFVICYSYHDRLRTIADLKMFIFKRFARLWPLHAFMTCMFLPFAFANILMNIELGDRFSLLSFLSNLALLQAFNLHDGTTWNLPAWSISVEFYTYIFFSVLFYILVNRKLQHLLLTMSLVSICSFIILFSFSNMGDSSYLAIFRCLYSFSLGVIAALIYSRFNVTAWFENITVIFVFSVLFFVKISTIDTLAFMMPLLFFVLVIVCAHEKGGCSKILKHSLLIKLGALSFSIYLTHAWVISSVKAVLTIANRLFDLEFMYIIDGSRYIDVGWGYANDLLYLPFLVAVIFISLFTNKNIELYFQKKILGLKA